MSCDKAKNCKKYKMNIGNPNDWENPCNHCHYNISDYDIGYNKAIDDFVKACNKQFAIMYGQRYVDMRDIVNIAEQLKEGGKNE